MGLSVRWVSGFKGVMGAKPPSLHMVAGSAEGGLERLGARGSARRFKIEKILAGQCESRHDP